MRPPKIGQVDDEGAADDLGPQPLDQLGFSLMMAMTGLSCPDGGHGADEVLRLGPRLLQQLGLDVFMPLHELGQPCPGRGDLSQHGEDGRCHNLRPKTLITRLSI